MAYTRPNVLKAVGRILSTLRRQASLLKHAIGHQFLVDNILPGVLVVFGHRLHQGFHKIFRRLNTQDGENTAFGLDPDGLLLGKRVYATQIIECSVDEPLVAYP